MLFPRHDEMEMGMEMGMDGDMNHHHMGSLSAAGVDFSNRTQMAAFLDDMLNDDQLKHLGNDYARYFWYGVVVVIGLATIMNIIQRATLKMRLRTVVWNDRNTSRPRHFVMRAIATATALARESTYLQYTPSRNSVWFRLPPMGTLMLILLHFIFVVVLEFTNNSVPGAQFWQARGVRAGWLAVAQMPLLILLVGKNNLISLFTGVSHERLNVLHRWTARITLFLAILHFGYQSYGWQHFGLMTMEFNLDECPATGIAAFALLLWLNLTTLAPFRHWSYEFFVVQHIITFFGFIIAVMYHLPETALWSRVYIYIPIALYIIDRLVRTALFTYFNIPAKRATLTALDGQVTRVRLTNKSIKSWQPGAYMMLSIPKFGWTQSHPATILSTPQSHNGDLVFLLKSHKGFTKRLMTHANTSSTALLPHTKQESEANQNNEVASYRAFTNGPYGGSQLDFAAFDSICLMAGSTGITFTLSLLQNLADRASSSEKRLPVHRIHLIWCVKDSRWTKWCSDEISAAHKKLRDAGVEIDVSIYVTCADSFTNQTDEPKACGCQCDKTLGPCCCVAVDEADPDAEDLAEPVTAPQGEKTTRVIATCTKLPSLLPCAKFHSGRPEVETLLMDLLNSAGGESAVAVCGPVGMTSMVRNTVVKLSDERAIHKGTGAQGCYLHVESFY